MIGKDVLTLLLKATIAAERTQYLKPKYKREILIEMSPKLNEAKMLVRLARKFELLDDQAYIKIETELVEVGKMLGGWIRWLDQNSSKSPPQ